MPGRQETEDGNEEEEQGQEKQEKMNKRTTTNNQSEYRVTWVKGRADLVTCTINPVQTIILAKKGQLAILMILSDVN